MERWIGELRARASTGGGFLDRRGGRYRSDATAWAIMTLSASGADADILIRARTRLAKDQYEDGRIPIGPESPDATWPTSLAVLAWHGSPLHQEALSRAVSFLLRSSGRHWKGTAQAAVGHDTALRGWPWVDDTHSWVEPTALAISALKAAGLSRHPRVHEGVRLLADRQLPGGGWNYGNTRVFGREQLPSPECTGAALQALAGLLPRRQVERSLAYLHARAEQLRTPIGLGWSLSGLSAWDELPREAEAWVRASLDRETRYGGGYDTTSLCLLLRPLAVTGTLTTESPPARRLS